MQVASLTALQKRQLPALHSEKGVFTVEHFEHKIVRVLQLKMEHNTCKAMKNAWQNVRATLMNLTAVLLKFGNEATSAVHQVARQ